MMRTALAGAIGAMALVLATQASAQGWSGSAAPEPVHRYDLPPIQDEQAGGGHQGTAPTPIPPPGGSPLRESPAGAGYPSGPTPAPPTYPPAAAPASPHQSRAATPVSPPYPRAAWPGPGAVPAWQAGVPQDPWRGLTAAELSALLARTPLPVQSQALQSALRRLLQTGSRAEGVDFAAARRGAMQRAGLAPVPRTARLIEAEQAVRAGALPPASLAQAYGAQKIDEAEIGGLLGAAPGPRQRALLFQAMSAATDTAEKAKLLKALAASAARDDLEAAVAGATRDALASIAPGAALSPFADTGIRLALLAGDAATARGWIAAAGSNGTARDSGIAWRAAMEAGGLGQPGESEATLQLATGLALAGGIGPELQHRLVTVLDALGYQVPIPLWEAASRTPQPAGGHLPETGALSRLSQAADDGQAARTLLLAIAALGPQGPAAAHLLTLGDVVRALKRVGLEGAARGVALEALLALLPARAGHG